MLEALIAGLYSGLASTLTKMCLNIVDADLSATESHKDKDLQFLTALFFAFGVAVASVVNLSYLNSMFELFEQLKAVPAYQSSVIICTLVTGGVILEEFKVYTIKALLLICLGTLICIIGLYYKIAIVK